MRILLVRFGLCALGLVYIAMGIASGRVAWLGVREREQGVGGALRLLLAQGKGSWLLAAVAAGLAALAVARVLDAVRAKRGFISRVGLVIDGLGYGVLSWTAVALLLHLRRGGPSLTRTGATWLLSESWGPAVLEIAGAIVALGGVRELWMGLSGRLTHRPDAAPRKIARALTWIARFGLAARGLVLCAIGWYIVRAAESSDATRIRTMGGTLRQVSGAPFGALILGVLACGLSAYGLYVVALGVAKRRV